MFQTILGMDALVISKMKYSVLSLLLLLVLIFLPACEEQDCGCGLPEEQPVLFEYRYTNFAWGYQENGWLIDREGMVRVYELPEDFRDPDSAGFMSLEDLEYNLSQADSVIAILEEEEFLEYTRLIPAAARGKISEAQNMAADAGASVLSCYIYDTEKEAYRYIFLAQSGDWEQRNLSPSAETLVEWLLELPVFWLSE
jgi:hypothetical protein